MPFVKIAGLKGKLYIPEKGDRHPKKHPCRDCFSCQTCSDDRCQVCRNRSLGNHRPCQKAESR